MFKRNFFNSLGAVLLIGIFILVGCSGDDKVKDKSIIGEIIDTASNEIAETFVEAAFASAAEGEKFIASPASDDKDSTVSQFGDVIINEPYLYAAFNGGLIKYDFRDGGVDLVRNGRKLSALTYHDGLLYVGGDGLFIARDGFLEPVEVEIKGTVTSLLSDSGRMIIGTDQGLYTKSVFGLDALFDDISVTALEFDRDGLWVGTDGQGLYRWNGEEFKKRFLLRDTSIFNHINDIDFNHGHIYVAAATGFFVYDGGRWEQWTADIGLPSDEINSVDASDWMVHIGTDKGVIAYFNKNLYPVRKLETMGAETVFRKGNDVIIVSEDDGIVMRSGMVIKTLVEPVFDTAEEEKPEVFTQAETEDEI